MQELTEMLPVGMVANGGLVAQIMAELAQRQRNLPGWEAFHYERVSETAVELTGGIVSTNHGNKRWLEPHDCITIPLAAVILEMQKQGLCEAKSESGKLATNERKLSVTDASTPNSNTQTLHVCFALPDDPSARLRVLQALHLDAEFLGARVLACHFENEKSKA
ncbi:MAG: hypothetical protein HY253_11230 [Burkholderiales bacterium]|nr:hypothetical protein [Burkholderiales bacterium]